MAFDTFYLGVATKRPQWLANLDVPLFISRRSLCEVKALPQAKVKWALDSGGFTQLHKHGHYHFTANQYASEIKRLTDSDIQSSVLEIMGTNARIIRSLMRSSPP